MPTASVNGVELHYEETGAGPPLLLVHGNGGNTLIWGEAPSSLGRSYRVIAYDRRGFGRSRATAARTTRDHVRDAAALLRQVDAAPATVLGWSGGGPVAAGLAVERPDLVSSLILEEPALHVLTHLSRSTVSTIAGMHLDRLRGDMRSAGLRFFRWALGYRTGGNTFDRFPREWQESMLACVGSVFAENRYTTWPYPRRRDLAGLAMPVTCLLGDLSDPLFQHTTRFAVGAVPGAKLREITGAAHAIHIDRPEEFLAAVGARA